MRRVRGRRHQVEQDDVNRWLVSYADYMTLLFALFVVLYAMAMVNEKQFESVTDSIGRVFQADKDKTKNRGHGDDILSVNTSNTSEILYGNHVLDATGPELVDKNVNLSNVSDSEIGTNLASIQSELYTALYDLVESGLAQLQIDGDWLEIELNSGLLFPSGSSSATNTARELMSVIYEVVGKTSNFIRIRGYTDNQPISNEFFSSNWELSVFRATAILRILEELNTSPARMAIEAYGEYYPIADNNSEEGRAKNRRVVIAISKYGLENENLLKISEAEKLKESLNKNNE
ncbi:MAG: chemotaxis protein MotB [Alteromonadaceae bacterium]|jgi:chemotaxis protein MotB